MNGFLLVSLEGTFVEVVAKVRLDGTDLVDDAESVTQFRVFDCIGDCDDVVTILVEVNSSWQEACSSLNGTMLRVPFQSDYGRYPAAPANIR